MAYIKQTWIDNESPLTAERMNHIEDGISNNDVSITSLDTRINSLAGGGQPIVVSQASDMTDQTKIYLYVGEETGYETGHWYYYDTTWTDGGQYGADGGINGNARNLLKYILERVAYTETGMQIYVDALYEALKQMNTQPAETYQILNTLVNVTNSNSATSIASESAYSATLSIESGYTWGTVTITMGGVDITSTAYNSSTHVISIASVTGNLVITASATAPVTTYTITNALSHVTNSNASASIQSGSAYSATLTPDTDYTIDTVTVTMGGIDVTSTAYDSSTNTITISSVTGDVVITASATAIPSIQVTYTQGSLGAPNTDANRVSGVITTALHFDTETLAIDVPSGYSLFPFGFYGNQNISLAGTRNASNALNAYIVSDSGYVVKGNDSSIAGTLSANGTNLWHNTSAGWKTGTVTYSFAKSSTNGYTFTGLGFLVKKDDGANITPSEIEALLTLTYTGTLS